MSFLESLNCKVWSELLEQRFVSGGKNLTVQSIRVKFIAIADAILTHKFYRLNVFDVTFLNQF